MILAIKILVIFQAGLKQLQRNLIKEGLLPATFLPLIVKVLLFLVEELKEMWGIRL